MEIITRKNAFQLGMKFYFSGVPCGNGHMRERMVSNYSCVECTRYAANSWAKKNKEKITLKRRERLLETGGSLLNNKKPCVDCGGPIKNLSEKAVRCLRCHKLNKSNNATGRTLPDCKACRKRLSASKNLTGLCGSCSRRATRPSLGFPKSGTPWNKGLKKYASEEEKISAGRNLRKIRRAAIGTQEHIGDRIRTLIRNSMKKVGVRKDTKTAMLLGCSTSEFYKHLEAQFIDGMNWGNYGNKDGQWNIDHIVKLCEFDLTEKTEQMIAFNFMNCRPLWAKDNFSHKLNIKREFAAGLTACVMTMGAK